MLVREAGAKLTLSFEEKTPNMSLKEWFFNRENEVIPLLMFLLVVQSELVRSALDWYLNVGRCAGQDADHYGAEQLKWKCFGCWVTAFGFFFVSAEISASHFWFHFCHLQCPLMQLAFWWLFQWSNSSSALPRLFGVTNHFVGGLCLLHWACSMPPCHRYESWRLSWKTSASRGLWLWQPRRRWRWIWKTWKGR